MINPLSLRAGDRVPYFALGSTAAAQIHLVVHRRAGRDGDALWPLVEAPSRRRPILAVFEDVHWIDPTSLELLDRAIERVPQFPILLLVTFRPDFDAPWIGQPHVHMLALNRLGRSASTALVGRFGSDGLRPRLSRRSSSGPTACRCSSRS